ncbi:MAG: SPOR domain-containing protein [Legionellaceae bacterium]|nr:SPOR domain-containing protein [Legionellaceae bacterium]
MDDSGKKTQTPDADANRTVLSPSSWLNKINFINHLVLFNSILTVMIAEKGAGKSSFAKILPKHLDAAISCYPIKANPSFAPHQLLNELSDNFHFSLAAAFDLATLVKTINERQKHVLLLIDDAHYLDDTFINDLLRVIQQQSTPAYFHVLLVSDYSLLPLLNALSREGYTDLIHTLELGALSLPELSTYLKLKTHHLPGLQGLEDKSKIKAFYELTEGVIAEVNLQMESYFSNAQASKTSRRKRWRPLGKIAASFLILAAASSYFMDQAGSLVESGKLLATRFSPSLSLTASDTLPLAMQAQQPLPSFIPVLDWTTASYPSQIAAIDWPLAVKAVPMSQLVQIKADIPQRAIHTVLPSALPAIYPKTPASPAPIQFAAQPHAAPRYRIQVVASVNATEVEKLAKQYPFAADTHIYKTVLKNTVWYVLTAGEYRRWKDAQEAIKSLPREVLVYRPWIRPVSTMAKATEYRPTAQG